jgi:HlyD family secretion protein
MKKGLLLVTLVCLTALVFSGCAKSSQAPQETAKVIRGDLVISVSVSGNLEMPHKTDLSFGTTGMVAEVLVDEGDSVAEGQTLARLDAQSLELGVQMAQNTCEMAEARYKTAQADYEIAENRLVRTIYPSYTNLTVTDLPGTWLALEEAQNNLKEAQELLAEGKTGEGQAQLELVVEGLIKAQEKLHSRRWALPLSVKEIELQTDQVKKALDIAELDLATAELGLANARLELDKATIVAPFDGIASEITINEGQQLSAMTYANPAICLVDPGKIEMSGVIDEIDIANVKLGREADITLDALPDKEVRGRVTFISQIGTVQAGVVSYKTTITLEKPDEELRDGMSATAEIIIDRHDNVLLIPNRAIQGSWDNPWVEVVMGEETEKREITLGLSDGMNAEVLSGLEEGEGVVLPAAQLPFRMFGG